MALNRLWLGIIIAVVSLIFIVAVAFTLHRSHADDKPIPSTARSLPPEEAAMHAAYCEMIDAASYPPRDNEAYIVTATGNLFDALRRKYPRIAAKKDDEVIYVQFSVTVLRKDGPDKVVVQAKAQASGGFSSYENEITYERDPSGSWMKTQERRLWTS